MTFSKSFADELSEGYKFEISPKYHVEGTRSLFYYKKADTLLISHIYSSCVHLLNLATGKLKSFDYHKSSVRTILVCNDEIITASWDGSVCVTDFETLKLKLRLTEKEMGRCPHIAVSPDHEFVYSYTYDSDKNPLVTSNTIRMWSLADGRLNLFLPLPGIHLSSRRCGTCEVYQGKLYVVSDSGHLHIFNAETGELLFEDFYNDQIQSLCMLPNFNMLAFAGGEGNIYVCDLSGKRILHKINAHRCDITQLVLHPDKPNVLLSVSLDGSLKIWRLPDLELLNSVEIQGDYLWTISVAKDILLAGGENGKVWVVDLHKLPDISFIGELVISDESIAILRGELNKFYASDLKMMNVRSIKDNEVISNQFTEYLLNTVCNFNVFKDVFSTENRDISFKRIDNKGFLQLI